MAYTTKTYIKGKVRKELRKGEREAAILSQLVDAKRDAIDIGANKGVYAELLSRICKRVYAFEPNPKMYSVLKRSCAKNVETFYMALSDKSGVAELRIPVRPSGYSNQGASLSTYKINESYASVEVKCSRLDELNLKNIGFIKIDVEGFELSVLRGAVETIKRELPIMLIEIEEAHTGMPIEEMIAEVEAYGYRCQILLNGQIVDFSNKYIEKHIRNAQTREDYIFNFIFVPIKN